MADDEEYDLDVLLRLRKKERDAAEQRYADAMEAHQKLGKEVQQLERRHRKMIQKRKRECRQFDDDIADGPATLAQIQKFDHYVKGLRDREEEAWRRADKARKKRRRARRKMEQAHDELLDAVRQLKAVEKHREKWAKQKEVEQKRRQAEKMDELAARTWRENRS